MGSRPSASPNPLTLPLRAAMPVPHLREAHKDCLHSRGVPQMHTCPQTLNILPVFTHAHILHSTQSHVCNLYSSVNPPKSSILICILCFLPTSETGHDQRWEVVTPHPTILEKTDGAKPSFRGRNLVTRGSERTQAPLPERTGAASLGSRRRGALARASPRGASAGPSQSSSLLTPGR